MGDLHHPSDPYFRDVKGNIVVSDALATKIRSDLKTTNLKLKMEMLADEIL